MKHRHLTASLMLALAFAGAGCGRHETAAAPIAAAATVAGLSVCIDNSSPIAAQDRKLADAVARKQGIALAVHEFDGSGNDDEGFEMKNFVAMAGDKCQLVLGFPMRDDASGLPGNLRATAAYGQTGFVLVTPTGSAARDLGTLPPGSRVAVTYQTMPNLWFANYPSLQADVRLSDKAAVAALEKGEAQAAMLWRPAVAQQLEQDGQSQRFRYAALNEPHAGYRLVALYADANAAAAKKFEASVAELRDNGNLAAMLQPYADAAGAAEQQTLGVAPPADPGPRPMLYTAAQATSGKAHFDANCALCHGESLAGRAGPALKGRHFAPDSGKYKVKDIFAIVHKNMPAMAPGSLPKQTYVEIMAYLLQQNGYPAGKKPLTYAKADASTVPLIYAKADASTVPPIYAGP